jgi:hypothetical protein
MDIRLRLLYHRSNLLTSVHLNGVQVLDRAKYAGNVVVVIMCYRR